jgi:hypothetical protein
VAGDPHKQIIAAYYIATDAAPTGGICGFLFWDFSLKVNQ